MPTDHRSELKEIRTFPSLVRYLRDQMDWPIDTSSFEDLTFEYTPEELGIDAENAAKIQEIKRLRPLSANQPWGIFFVKFEPKRLPIVALRRILSRVALKKRASANSAERAAWAADDLLFVSNYGEGDERQISFAHFSQAETRDDLPTLKVLGWDNLDTALHLDAVAKELTQNLAWPADEADVDGWRKRWCAAFTLRPREVITTSRELSISLAKLASAIRDRIKTALAIETDRGPLTLLWKAFREALIHDLNASDFADMYAQTIAYGLLSARITDPHKKTADDFAAHMRTNPFLKEMMQTFLKVGGRRGKAGGPGIDFDELGVSEVVELLDDPDTHMEDVVRDFGDRNPQEDPVIHFYELFLKEYDAKKRMQRGVFYTPRPVVSYIVRSVDELLRTQFGLEDGLADITTWGEMSKRHKDLRIPDGISPDLVFVQVLDPATGTGTFLVQVIDVIYDTLVDKWKAQGHGGKRIEALWNEYVPKHLLPRLHGYEILMAPYAIAHLKIGLKLFETGYHFDSEERARIYLTNALEPAHDFSGTFEFAIPALAHEAQAVNDIKRRQRFTVVMGNPPYSERSSNSGEWIDSLMERYKTTIRTAEAQIKAVSNDYVKFLCLADDTVRQSGIGVCGLITSNGYLDGRLFRDLRREWLQHYSQIDLLNLHGSLRRGDAAVDDENVFDIMQGVSVVVAATLVTDAGSLAPVTHRDLHGTRLNKYASLGAGVPIPRTALNPMAPLFLFCPSSTQGTALETWSLGEVFGTGNPRLDRNVTYAGGFKTRQDSFTVAFEEATLKERIAELADETIPEALLRDKYGLCSTAHFEFPRARKAAQSGLLTSSIRWLRYRPFDDRPMIWAREVLCEPQLEVTKHLLRPNLCLVTSRVVKDDAFAHVAIARGPVEVISLSSSTSTNAYMFPLFRYVAETLLNREDRRVANLSPTFLKRLAETSNYSWKDSGRNAISKSVFGPEDVVAYIYALLHSKSYRLWFADDLLRDFPVIPLPRNGALFTELVALGHTLITAHLLESKDDAGNSVVTFVGGRTSARIESVSYQDQCVWLDKKKSAGFQGVPESAWNFQVGGYQVLDKWLKSRKGRTLSKAELGHFVRVVGVLQQTLAAVTIIEAVLQAHGGWPGAFRVAEMVELPANASGSNPGVVEESGEELNLPKVEMPPRGRSGSAQEGIPTQTGVGASPRESFDGGGRDERPANGVDRGRHDSPVDLFDREELICIIRQLFSDGLTRTRDAAVAELARVGGYERTGSRIREELENGLRTAVRRGVLGSDADGLKLLAAGIADYERDFAKEQFLASLGGAGWRDRDDAIRSFARWLGYRRTGPLLDETARSLINGLVRGDRLETDGASIRRSRQKS
jgi:type I restriction-modification system DNA methylase subunit